MTDTKLVYLNGQIIPAAEALVPVMDRGLMFGEGVYEVVRYYGGRAYTMQPHAKRMVRSLEGIGIRPGNLVDDLVGASDELMQREGFGDGNVYWQVTRGPMKKRAFGYDPESRPTIVAWAIPAAPIQTQGVPTTKVMLVEDTRWTHCWIKSTMLMPNTIAYNAAAQAGCGHAVMVKDGIVKEANSANLFAVVNGKLRTYPNDGGILVGITRTVVNRLIGELSLELDQTPVRVDELPGVDELFLSGTNTEVTAVTGVVDSVAGGGSYSIGNGGPGPVTTRLREAFVADVAAGDS